jgi:signal transduction histidine kinase/CheY-like chemotaxis protein
VRHACGEHRWLRLSGVGQVPVGLVGDLGSDASAVHAGLVWIRGLVIDITEAKTLELQALEDARHKIEFLGRMSHDMRTPLHAIIGLGEILRSGQSKEPSSLVDSMVKAAEGLLGLVNDLLDIDEIRGGGQPIQMKAMDLWRVVWDCVALHRQTNRRSCVELRSQIDPQVPRYVSSDAKRLTRILNNLLENALKFTETGHVSVSLVAVAKREKVVNVSIRVVDTGPGIDEAEISHIFSPFFRGKSEEVRPRGQGLGLYIVRDLVAQLGGCVEVASTKGVGTTFDITLPLEEVHKPLESLGPKVEDQKGPAPWLGSAQERLRILVADDSPVNRQIIGAFLQSTGAQMEFAEDGRDALEVFGVFRPELVIMDLRMPVMSGAEATKAIRALEKERGWPRCRILAVSASALKEDVEAAEQAGCDEHFAKPIRRAALLAALDKHLLRVPGVEGH